MYLTDGRTRPISGRFRAAPFDLMRTGIRLAGCGFQGDPGAARIADDQRFWSNTSGVVTGHYGAVGRTFECGPKGEAAAIGRQFDAWRDLMYLQNRLA